MAWVIGGLVLVVIVVAVARLFAPSIARAVTAAVEQQNVAAVLAAIDKHSEASRPTLYNHAIRRLWDAYQRPLALDLIRELGKYHANSAIAQYWMAQAISVEPALAQQVLPREFLSAHFKPEVAAKCGSAG